MMIVINTIILITNRPVGKQKENIFPEKLFLLFGKFPPDTHTHVIIVKGENWIFPLVFHISHVCVLVLSRETKNYKQKMFRFYQKLLQIFFLLINKKNLTKTFFFKQEKNIWPTGKNIFYFYFHFKFNIFIFGENKKQKTFNDFGLAYNLFFRFCFSGLVKQDVWKVFGERREKETKTTKFILIFYVDVFVVFSSP